MMTSKKTETKSEFAQSIGYWGGGVKPSNGARIAAAAKALKKKRIMQRFAKSALTAEQKNGFVDAVTDDNARSVRTSVKVIEALVFAEPESDDIDELKAAMIEYKSVAERTIAELSAPRVITLDVLTKADGSQVVIVDDPDRDKVYYAIPDPAIELGKDAPPVSLVPRTPLSMKTIEAIAAKGIAAHPGFTPPMPREQEVLGSVGSFEEAVRVIEKSAAIASSTRRRTTH